MQPCERATHTHTYTLTNHKYRGIFHLYYHLQSKNSNCKLWTILTVLPQQEQINKIAILTCFLSFIPGILHQIQLNSQFDSKSYHWWHHYILRIASHRKQRSEEKARGENLPWHERELSPQTLSLSCITWFHTAR